MQTITLSASALFFSAAGRMVRSGCHRPRRDPPTASW